MISGFELTIRTMLGVGRVVKPAVCQRTAESFVKEQKQESDVNAFGREAVGITSAVALQKSVTFEFAEIVAELVQSIVFGGEMKGRDHSLVNLLGGPTADGVAAVQENFQQSNDSRIVDFDAGVTNRTGGDGQGDSL